MGKSNSLKPPLSFDEQLQKLKDHNLIIQDDEMALKILKEVNYYRLSGYGLPFRLDPHSSDYRDGTSFNQLFDLYSFDEELRNLLWHYIEIAEIYYRTQISYGFALNKCMNPPHDQHYNYDNYYRKESVVGIFDALSREKGHNEDSKIVKHHESKYAGRMPLWVIVELLSFSNLSKLYSSMYISEQDCIAKNVGAGRAVLTNHLHCLSILRNKCAHGGRLYGEPLDLPASLKVGLLRKYPTVSKDSLFAYIIVLYERLPNDESRYNFLNDLITLLDKNSECIDLSQMGFPDNYKQILSYKRS